MTARVRAIIRSGSAAHWEARFAGKDLCCTIVRNVREALDDPHFRARGLFDRRLTAAGRSIPALPMPIAGAFQASNGHDGYPELGEANAEFGIDTHAGASRAGGAR